MQTANDFPADVFLILTRGAELLLARRSGTGYADGLWNVPSGKLEPGEHVVAGVLREAREEVGLALPVSAVGFAAALHWRSPEGQGRLGYFFRAEHRAELWGEPVNAEPHKCSEIGWFPIDGLPADTVPYNVAGLALYRRGVPFGLAGWPDSVATMERFSSPSTLGSPGCR